MTFSDSRVYCARDFTLIVISFRKLTGVRISDLKRVYL